MSIDIIDNAVKATFAFPKVRAWRVVVLASVGVTNHCALGVDSENEVCDVLRWTRDNTVHWHVDTGVDFDGLRITVVHLSELGLHLVDESSAGAVLVLRMALLDSLALLSLERIQLGLQLRDHGVGLRLLGRRLVVGYGYALVFEQQIPDSVGAQTALGEERDRVGLKLFDLSLPSLVFRALGSDRLLFLPDPLVLGSQPSDAPVPLRVSVLRLRLRRLRGWGDLGVRLGLPDRRGLRRRRLGAGFLGRRRVRRCRFHATVPRFES